MTKDRAASSDVPPVLLPDTGGSDPSCPACGHVTGDTPWDPGRALLRLLGVRRRRVRLVRCGDTQWYEDDELSACQCRDPFHSA